MFSQGPAHGRVGWARNRGYFGQVLRRKISARFGAPNVRPGLEPQNFQFQLPWFQFRFQSQFRFPGSNSPGSNSPVLGAPNLAEILGLQTWPKFWSSKPGQNNPSTCLVEFVLFLFKTCFKHRFLGMHNVTAFWTAEHLLRFGVLFFVRGMIWFVLFRVSLRAYPKNDLFIAIVLLFWWWPLLFFYSDSRLFGHAAPGLF